MEPELKIKERDIINDPEKLQKEIHKMQRRLLTFHLHCETNEDDILERMSYDDRPRSEATKWMVRAHDNILKDLFDMQDDYNWICKSHYELFHGKPNFPDVLEDLDHNYSQYWAFRSNNAVTWTDFLVDPGDQTYDCWDIDDTSVMGWGHAESQCFDDLMHELGVAIQNLADVIPHVEEIVKVMKVQAAWRAAKVRLGLAAEGYLTKSQKEKNLPKLLRLLKTSFTPEEIRNFLQNDYRAEIVDPIQERSYRSIFEKHGLSKKKKKKSKKKKKKKKKTGIKKNR